MPSPTENQENPAAAELCGWGSSACIHSLRKTAINDAIRNGAQMHGRVLPDLPSVQLFSMLIPAARPLFSLPGTG